MADERKTRLAKLLLRQARTNATPGMIAAWASLGVSGDPLDHEGAEALRAWLGANWRVPDLNVPDFQEHLQLALGDAEFVILLNVWEAAGVPVLAPARGLAGIAARLGEIYPDGFLVADQEMSRGLLVNFDDHLCGAEIAWIGSACRAAAPA